VTDRPVPEAPGIADPLGPHQLQFGESPWRLTRRSFVGGRPEAIAALRCDCREAIAACRFPEGSAPEAEETLLGSLAEREPVDEEPGEWQLYEMDGPFVMVAGTRRGTARADPAPGTQVARAVRRVVIWGLGLRVGPEGWTLETFHLGDPSEGRMPGPPEILLPPESTRTVSLRVLEGGGMVAFRGSSEPEAWQAFFDRSLPGRGWRAAGDWRRPGSGWHRRYVGPAGSVDIRFGPEVRGELSGLLMINPPQPEPKESEQ
jgi:hypothetical protein